MTRSILPLLRCFSRQEKGALAVAVALTLVPTLAVFGLAVNYSSALSRRTDYQAVADAAALAGATASAIEGDEARKSRAKAWFDTQAGLMHLTPASVDVQVKDGTINVKATATVDPLVKVFPAQTIQVASTAQIATQTIRRVLDVAFCIDATGSMQNTINSVKARANSFSDDLNNALAARGLDRFDYVRIRAVFYRDFSVDDGQAHTYGWYSYIAPLPMITSGFFDMPGQKASLTAFLGTQNANGGGDLPESGYECINEGLRSHWFQKGATIPGTAYKADAVYPVIVLWSDADALPINHAPSVAATLYPANMPRNIPDFVANWSNADLIDQTNRMLVHFGLCANASWSSARMLTGYMCGGTLNDGNTNMVNKIADAMVVRYRNLTTRLTR